MPAGQPKGVSFIQTQEYVQHMRQDLCEMYVREIVFSDHNHACFMVQSEPCKDPSKAKDRIESKDLPRINPETHPPPYNMKKWIEEHQADLKPPVSNKLISGAGQVGFSLSLSLSLSLSHTHTHTHTHTHDYYHTDLTSIILITSSKL